MKPLKTTGDIPVWLDRATRALVEDIIGLLSERHPDLLAIILYGSVARHEERPVDAFDSFSPCLTAMIHHWMSTRVISFLIPLVWRILVT